MKRKFVIGIDGSGVDALIQALERLDGWFKAKSQELLNRLVAEGYQVASAGFATAQYDGTNDVSVRTETRGETTRAVVAVGSAALFIEFGTGISFPEHPEPHGMTHGSYGFGFGGNTNPPGWRYPESKGAGTGGVPDPDHPGYYKTLGNPANKPMYDGVKKMEEQFAALAREVFSGD